MSTLIRLALALAACLAAASPGRAQTAAFPPGSAVGIAPPPGMKPSAGFAGFEDATTGASIIMSDLPPEAFDQILPTFTPEGLAGSGLQAAGPAADWPVKNGKARILRGKQPAHGLVFRKWILLARGPASTAMLSIQAPETTAKTLPDSAIETALKTVALRQPPSLDEQLSSLPFRFGDLAGFRPVRVMSGTALMLTEGPQDSVAGASQPVIVANTGAGASNPAAKDRTAFSRSMLGAVAGASDMLTDKEQTFEIGGVPWSRIEGKAVYRATGEAIYVVQFIRFAADRYVRMVGVSRTVDQERYADRFRRLAESVVAK